MAEADDKSLKKGGLPPLRTLGQRRAPTAEDAAGPERPPIRRGGAAAVAEVPPPPPGGVKQAALPPPPPLPRRERSSDVPLDERETAVGNPEELSEEIAAFFDGEDEVDQIDSFQERTTIPAPYSEDSARLMMQRAQSGAYAPIEPETIPPTGDGVPEDDDVRPSAITKPAVARPDGGPLGALLKNKLILGGAAAAIVVLVVVLVVALSGGEEPSDPGPDPSASAPANAGAAGGSSTTEVDDHAEASASAPASAGAAGGSSTAEVDDHAEARSAKADEQPAVPAAPAPPGQIKITLEGMPTEATVKINGVPVSPPLLLPRSSSEVTLTVHATGYRSFWQKLVPDRDLTIDVKMYRRGKGGKGGSGGSTMADNPWQ